VCPEPDTAAPFRSTEFCAREMTETLSADAQMAATETEKQK
jgi:hypothetical protein